jgi:hypothetical protein
VRFIADALLKLKNAASSGTGRENRSRGRLITIALQWFNNDASKRDASQI